MDKLSSSELLSLYKFSYYEYYRAVSRYNECTTDIGRKRCQREIDSISETVALNEQEILRRMNKSKEIKLKDNDGNQIYIGDILEIKAFRTPHNSDWPKVSGKHDGSVKIRVTVEEKDFEIILNKKNNFNERIKAPKGNEKCERHLFVDDLSWIKRHKDTYIKRLGNIEKNSDLIK